MMEFTTPIRSGFPFEVWELPSNRSLPVRASVTSLEERPHIIERDGVWFLESSSGRIFSRHETYNEARVARYWFGDRDAS
jgi:hypothetical protein